MADFQSKFYKLEGNTIQERKKHFYQLLHKTHSSISNEELDLEPHNFLEELFKVEALIYFRRSQPLMKILREGNVVFISKIIKQKWFCQEVFTHFNKETFVNEILPIYSYSIRMKILKVISALLDEGQMDVLFDCLLQKYGLFIAAHFLSHCSSSKIRHVLNNYIVKLSLNQLKVMFDKDKSLIPLYLKEAKRHNFVIDYVTQDKILFYIAQKDPGYFINLRNELDLFIWHRLGRRTTKGLIKHSESEISNNLKKYKYFLNLWVMSRKIKTFEQLILEQKGRALLESPDQDTFMYLRLYPRSQRWNVFARIFREQNDQDILDNLIGLHQHYLDPSLLHVPRDLISKWAELNYKTSHELDYLVKCETKFSIPIIKEKLNLMSNPRERGFLLEVLIQNCLKNKDLKSLEHVLSYICSRHRNETLPVRNELVSIIKASDLNLCGDFNDAHWKYMNELLTMFKVRKEPNNHSDLKQTYVEYLYTNKSDKYELFSRYIKDDVDELKEFIENFELERDSALKMQIRHDILIDFGRIISKIEVENSARFDLKLQLLEKIVKFNRMNPNYYQISAVDLDIFKDDATCATKDPSQLTNEELRHIRLMWEYDQQNAQQKSSKKPFGFSQKLEFVSFLKRILDNQERLYEASEIFRLMCEAIKKPQRSVAENQILDLVFTQTSYNLDDVRTYFLKNEPIVILRYAGCSKLWNIKSDELYVVKKCAFLNLDQKFIDAMVDCLPKRKPMDRIDIIKCLSMLMSTKDFLKLIEPLVPKEIKLDLENEEQKQLYQLQCEVAKTLRNVLEFPPIAGVVVQFFQGDYLQSTLPVLYKLMYRSPESVVSSVVQILSKRAVSARKHALVLACQLLPVKIAEQMHFDALNNEKNASCEKYCFNSALVYFAKNPSQHFLEMLCSNLGKISEHDTELLSLIVTSFQVPRKFQPKYVESLWGALEHLKNQSEAINVEPYQKGLLLKINFDLMQELDKHFLEQLIENYFLSESRFHGKMHEIVLNYLQIYLQDDTFQFVFNLLKKFKDEFWERGNKTKIQTMFNFFDEIYRQFDKSMSQTFLPLFKKYWGQCFTYTESFKEHLALDLLSIYEKDKDIRRFAQEVNTLFKQWQETFQLDSFSVVELTNGSFQLIYNRIKLDLSDFNSISLANDLINTEKNLTNMLFALSELKYKNYDDEPGKNLLKVLQAETHPIIQIELTALCKRA